MENINITEIKWCPICKKDNIWNMMDLCCGIGYICENCNYVESNDYQCETCKQEDD